MMERDVYSTGWCQYRVGVSVGECVYQEPPRSSYIIKVLLRVDPYVTETLGSSHTSVFLFPTHVNTLPYVCVLQSLQPVHMSLLWCFAHLFYSRHCRLKIQLRTLYSYGQIKFLNCKMVAVVCSNFEYTILYTLKQWSQGSWNSLFRPNR